jgi:type IV pilus assembly protein PilW
MNNQFAIISERTDAYKDNMQRGMSLIELMVGMAIGLLATLIIMQVWGVFESQKQRTVSGSTAQANGLLALTEVEQDVRSAGAGLNNSDAFNCTSIYSYYDGGGTSISPLPAYAGGMGMAPVRITDGGSGSDTLMVKRGDDPLGSISVTLTNNMPSSSSELNVSSTAGFADGDVILAVDPTSGNCTVMLITQVQGAALKLQHNPGGQTTYNPSNAFKNNNNWPAYSSGQKIMKMGQLVAHSYTVNATNQLIVTDSTSPTAATTAVLADEVIKMKVQYGIANVGSQDVSAWVNATTATGWDTLDAAKVKRIKAIRVAVVARSSKKEGSDVSSACQDGAGTVVNANGPCVWPDSEPLLNLSSNTDWKKYRYRVYQTVIPLRNVIWAGV